MFKGFKPILYGGPRGLAADRGRQGRLGDQPCRAPGAWAAAGGIGTVSAVNADSYDPEGRIIPQIYHALTRRERHEELIRYAIDGAVQQVQRAYDIAGGAARSTSTCCGRWAAPSACSTACSRRPRAWSPASPAAPACPTSCPRSPPPTASTICRSSARRAPSAPCGSGPIPRRPNGWRRWSTRIPGWPAAITASPTPRTRWRRRTPIRASRRCARRCARAAFRTACRSSWPAASGTCSEWEHWIDNPELGQIAFQFGTRPLLTKESPIPEEWKARLMTLEEGDILLHRFSPTGFYSSAVRNPFLRNLEARSQRQIAFTKEPLGDHPSSSTSASATSSNYWVTKGDLLRAREWYAPRLYRGAEDAGRDAGLRHPRGEARRSARTRPIAWAASANAASRPGRTMRRTRPAASPIRAASASRRRCRTSPMAARSSTTSCSPATRAFRFKKRSLLFERLRADGEAARRSHPDRRLSVARGSMFRRAVSVLLLLGGLLALGPASAQTVRAVPYWASIVSGRAMMRTGPGENYPGTWLYVRPDLPIRVIEVYHDWRKVSDPRRDDGLDAGAAPVGPAHRDRAAGRAAAAARGARRRPRRSASAPRRTWSAGSRAAPAAGAGSTCAGAAAISASTRSGASIRTRR